MGIALGLLVLTLLSAAVLHPKIFQLELQLPADVFCRNARTLFAATLEVCNRAEAGTLRDVLYFYVRVDKHLYRPTVLSRTSFLLNYLVFVHTDEIIVDLPGGRRVVRPQ